MIKCIATDMDGTLLNGRMEVSEENCQAVKEAQAQGIEVVVATGRSYAEARYALDQADIHCPIIGANGAEVRNVSGEILSHSFIEKETAARIFRMLKEIGLYFEIYTAKGTLTDDYEKALDIMVNIFLTAHSEIPQDQIREAAKIRFTKGLLQLVDSYEEIIHKEDIVVYKFLAFSFEQEKLSKAREQLSLIDDIAISSSGSENIEITHLDAQKGIALERFIKEKGISLQETMAIGDNFNDVSMLERVGFPVAMGNADPEVKALCNYVTATNDEHGVAAAIEKVISVKNHENFS
ncbi:Cof-type HAD-IIB family hydrolase [Bacillus sp. REN10]|uniref:Cof-type HAD-IIB family hydrolase n=1 Tax=Bacillus sp. REN10 TaxID=2782541 RepID=UPI00193B26C8|nr:Cof-type HAD-IIB family hydrolase [Bacillus sp. REN10]